MHPIFKVSKKDIQQLNDEQARELIAKLCSAELRGKGLSPAGVMWGGDQRAEDGGVDVRVKVEDGIVVGGYIPRANTIFQVKAVQAFADAKIKAEMAPKGQLLPSIMDLAECSGSYIIASTKGNESDSALRSRKLAMKNCIDNAGFAGRIHFDFYDSEKIADWVEQHPAIVIWVKDTLGMPIVGWRPYAPWAYLEQDVRAEYLVDDMVKVIPPDSHESILVTDAIKQLRQTLEIRKTSVRIVGLSGVGKTRLVQALFDERIVPEVPPLECNNVIYTDTSDSPSPQPNTMLEALLMADVDTLVIVDNCGAGTHGKLTELVKRRGSKITLVTLEYDIRDDLPDETQCYRLEASSDELIKQLLARRYSKISQNDIEKIADFSSGNARVAFALASTSKVKGQLSKLENSELFKRLFWQHNNHDEYLLRSAEVCSLLYSFDAEDVAETSELSFLASLAEVSVRTLVRHVTNLQKRGLMQQRGKWKALLPHAIANRLAEDALKDYQHFFLSEEFFANATPRITTSFAHRLESLHESKAARDIAVSWLCRYTDLAQLNNIELQIFRFIAPIDQRVTLSALSSASQSDTFVSKENFYRKDFIAITLSLAYEEQYFDEAVTVLSRFAICEPQSMNQDSARKNLASLFRCYAPGTLASPSKRVSIVRKLMEDLDYEKAKLGGELLMEALKSDYYAPSYRHTFGAHSRGSGWQPQTVAELQDWYVAFVSVAHQFGVQDSQIGAQIRREFADQFRRLWAWIAVDLSVQLKEVAESFNRVMTWADGWLAVKEILKYDQSRISSSSLLTLKELDAHLAPQNLGEEIRAKVLCQNSYYDIVDDNLVDGDSDEDSRYIRYQNQIENLGIRAGKNVELISELLPALLKANGHNNTPAFSCGVAKSFEHIDALLKDAKTLIPGIDSSELDLTFVCGLIREWHKIDAKAVSFFLNCAVEDPVWGEFFPFLAQQIPLDSDGHERLMRSIELCNVPVWRYRCLQNGRATAPLSVDQVMTLISSIGKKSKGMTVAIEILYMVVYGAKEKDDSYRMELEDRCILFLLELDWDDISDNGDAFSHHVEDIIEFSLQSRIADSNITSILTRIIDFDRVHNAPDLSKATLYLKHFLRLHTKKTLDYISRFDCDGNFELTSRLFDKGFLHREHFFQPPSGLVVEWCQVSPEDRFPFVASICSIFDPHSSSKESDTDSGISEIAKSIFHFSPNKERILQIFVERISPMIWSGSRSNIIRRRASMLHELNPEGDPIVARLIQDERTKLEEITKHETEVEESLYRGKNESFE